MLCSIFFDSAFHYFSLRYCRHAIVFTPALCHYFIIDAAAMPLADTPPLRHAAFRFRFSLPITPFTPLLRYAGAALSMPLLPDAIRRLCQLPPLLRR